MNGAIVDAFVSRIEQEVTLKDEWQQFSANMSGGQLESREKAFILFSQALKISQWVLRQNKLTVSWMHVLGRASFSLCAEGKELQLYRFDTLTELLKLGKEAFEVDIVEIDPQKDDLVSIAVAIESIGQSALGSKVDVNFLQKILAQPNNLCFLAKERQTSIACAYGTYVELPTVKLFHINFLGRKLEYPGVGILQKLLEKLYRIQERFPHVQYLTLCAQTTNIHMMPIYRDLGFVEIDFIEKGHDDRPMYFFGKKLDASSDVKHPLYSSFKAAITAQRALS